jgi:RNA polymerase sigma-70 factor, ECF subfamily
MTDQRNSKSPAGRANMQAQTPVMQNTGSKRVAAASDETALLQRLLAGDEAAFTSLVDRYHGALLRLAQAFVSSRSVAEEVVQETWLGVINGLSGFEARSALKTWIFRILINRARTKATRESRSVPFSALDAGGDPEPAVDPARFTSAGKWAEPPRPWEDTTPEKLLLQAEARAYIERAIDQLPATQRTVVILRDVEGCDSSEVCHILEISETNARVLLHRARAKLRRKLEVYLDRG